MSETGHGVFNREDACMNMLPALTLHIKHLILSLLDGTQRSKKKKAADNTQTQFSCKEHEIAKMSN